MHDSFKFIIILMDFKMRFPNARQEGNPPQQRPSTQNAAINNPFARMSQPQSGIRPSVALQQPQAPRGLNKYAKKLESGVAPKGQFNKYMLAGSNVFYEDRPEMKELEKIKIRKWVLIVLGILLSVSYFAIKGIVPHSGPCPRLASCGVFVRCPQYYQLDSNKQECVPDEDFLNEIQAICEKKIDGLQYKYGDNQCQNIQEVPSIKIDKLFEDIQDSQKAELFRRTATDFFSNLNNQKKLGYEMRWNEIFPTQKQWTLGCALTLALRDDTNQWYLVYLLMASVAIGIFMRWYNKDKHFYQIYEFLKKRVLEAQNQTLNIPYALEEIKDKFGPVDEEGWNKINEIRAKEKKIGYYEDDFLYWKLA